MGDADTGVFLCIIVRVEKMIVVFGCCVRLGESSGVMVILMVPCDDTGRLW
jgi:hypothetical protein